MKILFVSSSPLEYSASSNMRNIALLKGFIENGYKVYTLTPEPQKDSIMYDENICDIKIEKRYFIPLGSIHSAVTMKKNKKSKLKDKIYKFLKRMKIYDFRSSLAKKEIYIEEKFDFIISSSDPKSSHLIAENLKKRNPGIAKKWIQYWGDPFADDINNKGIVPNFIIKKEEERILSLADMIIYVSPFTLDKQNKLYPTCKSKMIFLPIPYKEKIFYEKVHNEKMQLGYFGDYYYRNRNINPLYNTVKKLKDTKLIVCGNSDIELDKAENIEILNRQSITKVREMEEKSNILVCICNKKGTQIPGKIYHYAATNKPILVILDGEKKEQIKEYLETFNRFELCYNTEESINKKIKQMLKKADIECEPCESFNPMNIAKKILEINSEKNNL